MKDTIELALEAKLAFDSDEYPDIWQVYMNAGRDEIKAFEALVRADERDACAKVCETEWSTTQENVHGLALADMIRARGEAE